MGKHLDWYLVELERSIGGKMNAETAFELINQTEDHIHMIKQELMMAGMDELSAEQAAIARFGELEVLTGRAERPLAIRANWAAPALILVGSTVVVGGSMFVGSAEAMIMAGSMGIAGLVVSALLCCRRGSFPGLAFGILLAVCFACLSCIATMEFSGPRFDFVKRADRGALVAILESAQMKVQHSDALVTLGRKWAHSDSPESVPAELRTNGKYIVPQKNDWNGFMPDLTMTTPSRNPHLRMLFGWSGGRLVSQTMAFEMTTLRHRSDALARWRDFENSGFSNRFLASSRDELAETISMLKNEEQFRQDKDNLFVGVFFGVIFSSIWMFVAFVLNRMANIDWRHHRPARGVRPTIAD